MAPWQVPSGWSQFPNGKQFITRNESATGRGQPVRIKPESNPVWIWKKNTQPHRSENKRRRIILKIAIARDGSQVSGHFGHCESYALFEAENSEIRHIEDLKSPAHEPGKLPPFLASHGVNLIIAGGMGQRAVDLFHENGIEVILGVSGSIDKAAHDYLAGSLVDSGSICSEHQHQCAEHE
ncbi:MAG: NifB/NifX family molybdenum-iron cluster-binding protein [Methanobacteriota archaeon]